MIPIPQMKKQHRGQVTCPWTGRLEVAGARIWTQQCNCRVAPNQPRGHRGPIDHALHCPPSKGVGPQGSEHGQDHEPVLLLVQFPGASCSIHSKPLKNFLQKNVGQRWFLLCPLTSEPHPWVRLGPVGVYLRHLQELQIVHIGTHISGSRKRDFKDSAPGALDLEVKIKCLKSPH